MIEDEKLLTLEKWNDKLALILTGQDQGNAVRMQTQ